MEGRQPNGPGIRVWEPAFRVDRRAWRGWRRSQPNGGDGGSFVDGYEPEWLVPLCALWIAGERTLEDGSTIRLELPLFRATGSMGGCQTAAAAPTDPQDHTGGRKRVGHAVL